MKLPPELILYNLLKHTLITKIVSRCIITKGPELNCDKMSDHGGMTEKEMHLFFLSDISIYLS